MSYPHTKDPDGIFLGSDGDEVDFARAAVNVITLADIPPVFIQKDEGKKESLPGDRLSLILDSWGTRVSDVKDSANAILALVTFKTKGLNEGNVKKVHGSLETVLGETKLKFLRWGGDAMLFSFKNIKDYKTLGDYFIRGKLDSLAVNITKIKGASFINAPKCFIEILSSVEQGKNMQDTLNDVISTFSGAFTNATILESRNLTSQDDFLTKLIGGAVPSVAVTLIFAVQAQSLAAKAKAVLSKSPWQQVTLPGPIQDEVGFDTDYYVHTKLPLPLIGLKTGAPGSGVQITSFVQNKENFDKMVKFYQERIAVAPVAGCSSAAGILSSKFAISRQSELVVGYWPGLRPVKIDAAHLCFRENFASGQNEVEIIHDVEGNQVVVVPCYK